MSDNIDIKIREDGSRVVSRNLNDIADSADKADKSVKNVNSTLKQTGNASTSLERLKRALDQTNISLMQAFDSSRVERFGRALVQYRNGLMKHFEEISKGARASSAAIKSQMEALTAKPIGLEVMSAYYREQEDAHNKFLKGASDNIAKQLALEAESSAERLKLAGMRRAEEEKYTAWWAKELSARDALEQKAIADSVRNLKLQEEAEQKSYTKRIKDASTFAAQAINAKKTAEEAYTTWWIAELKKRDTAASAANLKSAQQRSGMQAFNAERLDRSLIKGANPQSALYAADDSGATNRRTALQTMELQAMQRQMAMMQLLYPMAQAQLALDKDAEATAQRHIRAKESLVTTNGKLAASTKTAADNQNFWNDKSREAHALARGLSGSLGQLWLTYGSILPLLTGAALGSAFVGAAKSGGEMAYQLAFVKALGGETEQAISRLSDQAHELGTKGANGPKELASGYRVLSQAGKNAAESLAIMPDVLNLATVGELKMEEAGLAIVGTMNAFRLQTEDSTRVSDLFAKAAAVSQSSVQDLTQSMRYASTTSTMYKQNLEDTMTALTLLARVNITGTSAGTAYRNMLKEIYTPTEKAKRSWQDLGIKMTEVVDGKEKVRSFVDIMYDLQKVMSDPKKGFTEKGQLNIIGELFGERGSKEAAEMLTIVKGKWMELRDELANSKGFGQKVTDALNNTAKNQWAAALNTLESSLAKSFDNMENGFVGFAAKLKEIFASEEFRDTLDQFVKAIVTLGNALLEASPYLLDFAKAWLVLKAAQVGVSLGQIMLAAASGAQMLAAGMLAASGAMGPVARGATMLGPAIAALGGPLSLILGLLAAGAAAWLLWGRNAETASGKAIKSSEERLRELEKKKKFGASELGSELGSELAELETREQRLTNMIAAGAKGDNLAEARKSVEMQQKIVDLLQEQEYAQKNLANAEAKKAMAAAQAAAQTPGYGPNGWEPPKRSKGGSETGASGRLNKDDNALAKLQAQLLAAEKEYALIVLTGEAQFKLNDGQTKSLEIQQKIEELQSKNISELKDKGLKAYNDQLASLQKQLEVADKLGKQIQDNELLKVNSKIDEEVRLTTLLPTLRETENKYLAFRNELLGKGVVMDEAQAQALRDKVASQLELNRVTQARDQFLANSDSQLNKNFGDQLGGLQKAQQSPDWTQNDTNKTTMGMLGSMGIDTSMMQAQQDAQLAQLQMYYDQVNALRAVDKTNAAAYEQALGQLSVRRQEIQLQNAHSFFGSLAALQSSGNKKLGAIGKAAAITQATMDGVLAVQKAYTGGVYPWNIAMAAAQGALAAANVAKIAGLQFATGGGFTVGGSGGVDSQQVSFRASPGERVTVATPTQVRKGDELNKNQKQTPSNSDGGSVKIINVVDPNMLQDYLSTPAGERVLVNTIQRNAGAIRTVMNG